MSPIFTKPRRTNDNELYRGQNKAGGFMLRSAVGPNTVAGGITGQYARMQPPRAMAGISNTNGPRMTTTPGGILSQSRAQPAVSPASGTVDSPRSIFMRNESARLRERADSLLPKTNLILGPGVPQDPNGNASQPAPRQAGIFTPQPVRPPTGPMATVTGLDNRDVRAGAVLRIMDQYNGNPGTAGRAQRADALEQTWERGGTPVIGKRGGLSAPVQDFGGVFQGPRGIDTGMRPGSPEAAAHQARMDQAGGTGIFGGRDRAAALERNRSAASRSAGGIFSRDRVAKQPTKRERLLNDAMALERAKNEGGIQAQEIAAGASRYNADRQAESEIYKADKVAEADGVRWDRETAAERRNAFLNVQEPVTKIGDDGLPYRESFDGEGRVVREQLIKSEDDAMNWRWAQARKVKIGQNIRREDAAAWAQTGKDAKGRDVVPVYDYREDRPRFITPKEYAQWTDPVYVETKNNGKARIDDIEDVPYFGAEFRKAIQSIQA